MLRQQAQETAATLQRRTQGIGHRFADEAEGIHQGGLPGAVAADQEGDVVEDQPGIGERPVVAEPEFLDRDATHRDLEGRKRDMLAIAIHCK